MYEFLTGPALWLVFLVTIGGCIVHVIQYFRGLNWKLERVAYKRYPKEGFIGAARSILYWLIPFGTRGWRVKPVFCVMFFAFHVGLVFTPLFLEAHNVLFKQGLGFSLPTISPFAADILSWTVIVTTLFFVLRRIALPEVRIITTAYDYLLLAIAVAPFVTGLICRYQLGDYDTWLLLHIISGEVWLLAIPFTKLSHVVHFFCSRAQLGMDYGIKRGGLKGNHIAW